MNEFRISEKLMGCGFELKVVSKSQSEANHFLELGINEIKRIEDLISEFKADSITSAINRNAGMQPVAVSREVFDLMERSLRLSSLTQGAFDISTSPLKKLYDFKNQHFSFPKDKDIQRTLAKVGWKNILLKADDLTVFLKEKGMHISFAAIGKGYAADRVKQLWKAQGLSSGVINASGDLTAFGYRPDGSSWKIGIANPDNRNEMLFYIPATDTSVATSGDYEQYFIHKGRRYSHNINPVTGMPLEGIKSVSIVSPSAELSDALATAVYVMGVDTGLHLIDQFPDTHAIVVDEKNEVYFSKKLDLAYES